MLMRFCRSHARSDESSGCCSRNKMQFGLCFPPPLGSSTHLLIFKGLKFHEVVLYLRYSMARSDQIPHADSSYKWVYSFNTQHSTLNSILNNTISLLSSFLRIPTDILFGRWENFFKSFFRVKNQSWMQLLILWGNQTAVRWWWQRQGPHCPLL